MRGYFLVIFIVISSSLLAQIDTLQLSNGNELVGEIKSMQKGVLVIETDFSDSDFKVEWDKVVSIKTQSRFLITTEESLEYSSPITSVDSARVVVYKTTFNIDTLELEKIVHLNAFEDKFIDRLSVAIDVGFDLTKARNLTTFATSSTIGYTAKKWLLDASFNSLWSSQDETENIVRNEGDINYKFISPKKWFGIATVSLLSNTEQYLDLRSNIQVGFGRFLVRKNSAYWGIKLGVNRNIETYDNTATDSVLNNRDSWELYIGNELDLFDIGDFSLTMSLMLYPSMTESGRFRSDANFNLKYDLFFDFYIRAGGSVNYDNQPGADVSEWDYILQTGVGWKLN